MESCFSVYFGNKSVGKVQVVRQGLYYRFCCRCRMERDIVCRLYVSSGDKRENLGVVVPVDGGFGLETKVPVKRLPEDNLEFCLIPKTDTEGGYLVPVYPEEPFGYISRLKTAYLVRQENGNYLCIK